MNRADRLHAVLSDGRTHSRHDIFRACGEFFLTNNAAAELRARGIDVQHTVKDGEHLYRLVGMLNDPAGVGATKASASSLPAPAGSLSVSQPCGASPATDGEAADTGGERGTLILFGKEAA